MRAGLLTEIIYVYKPIITISDYGEQSTSYVLDHITKARVDHTSGNRNISNGEVVFDYSKIFIVRIYNNIDELDRLKWNNKFYRILSIEPNKELQQLTITTELIND